jgi:vacuolar-type H+-ATPase subunit C/Vma6
VNARARGLGSRLLEPEALLELARIDGIGALARALAARGVIPDDSAAGTAAELALAVRRAGAREVAILRRWLGPRDAALAVALDGEDRRSLRALLRGAAEGAPPEVRLTGLIPTPSLPERILRELAEQTDIRDQAVLLVAAGHPTGSAVLEAVAEREPDLFRVEIAIARVLADRATRGTHRAGTFLREHVAGLIDRDNARAALILAATGDDEPVAPLFLAGGHLQLEEFERAIATGDPASAAGVLGRTRGAGGIADLLLRYAASPGALEAAVEEDVVGALRRQARHDPLGPAPVLLFLHRIRRQSAALGRLIWGADLGAPAALRLSAGPAL